MVWYVVNLCCCLGKLFKEIYDERKEDQHKGEDFDDEVYGVEKEPPLRNAPKDQEKSLTEPEATDTKNIEMVEKSAIRLDPNG